MPRRQVKACTIYLEPAILRQVEGYRSKLKGPRPSLAAALRYLVAWALVGLTKRLKSPRQERQGRVLTRKAP